MQDPEGTLSRNSMGTGFHLRKWCIGARAARIGTHGHPQSPGVQAASKGNRLKEKTYSVKTKKAMESNEEIDE